MHQFLPEGLHPQPEGDTKEELLLAMQQRKILQAPAIKCDERHDRHIALGCCAGVMPRAEAARGILGGGRIARLRLLAAALFGGLYAAAALFAPLGVLQGLPMKLVSLVIMLLIAFGAGRQTLRTGLLFLAAVCAFAGAAVLAAQLFGTGVLVLPGGTFYAVSVLGLLLLAGLLYMLCYTIFSCTAQHGGEIRTMTLLYGGNRVPVRALHDTGCTLRDPMTGERVLVAEADALRALLPDASITPAALADPAELLLRLKTRAPALPARLLSYKCVGTQAGLILCLRCEIQVRPGVRKRCLAAFSPTPVSDGGNYDALIGGTIG